jgi:hypothetical protein
LSSQHEDLLGEIQCGNERGSQDPRPHQLTPFVFFLIFLLIQFILLFFWSLFSCLAQQTVLFGGDYGVIQSSLWALMRFFVHFSRPCCRQIERDETMAVTVIIVAIVINIQSGDTGSRQCNKRSRLTR